MRFVEPAVKPAVEPTGRPRQHSTIVVSACSDHNGRPDKSGPIALNQFRPSVPVRYGLRHFAQTPPLSKTVRNRGYMHPMQLHTISMYNLPLCMASVRQNYRFAALMPL